MDFELALNQILYELKINDIEYGLVGGLALGILGIDRATSDIDFLVQNSDKDLVRKIMLDLKYESIFHSINFSLFQSPLKALGEIDFIHPDTNTISEILSRKVNYSIFNDKIQINVVKADDLIILKLQAIKLDQTRKQKDESDIISLISIYYNEIDKDKLIKFGKKLNMENYILDLWKRIKNE